MMTYLLLLTVFVGCLYVSWVNSGRSFIDPKVIICAAFSVSTIFAAFGTLYWNSVELKWETLGVVVSGILAFCFGSWLMQKTYQVLRMHKRLGRASHVQKIRLSSKTVCISGALLVVVIILILERIYETAIIAQDYGIITSNPFEMIKEVRLVTDQVFSAGSATSNASFSVLARQGEKIVSGVGYALATALAFLDCAGEDMHRWKKAKWMMICALFSCVIYTLLTGSRGSILHWIIVVIVGRYLIQYKEGRQNKFIPMAKIPMAVVFVALCGVGFYFLGAAVGRTASTGPIEYLTFYYGAGIPSFEKLMDGGEIYGTGFTFYNLLSTLNKIGLVNSVGTYSMGWVVLGGLGSNVFTAFARFYFDFGIIGVIVLSTLSGLLFHLFYIEALQTNRPELTAIYLILLPYLIDYPRDEFLFSRFLSPSMLIVVCITILIIHIYVKGTSKIEQVSS